MTDPYQVLGVSPNATDDEVKKAYRELSRKYHPDSYVDNPLADLAEDKFKQVQEAYKQIMDERARGGFQQGGQGYSSQGGSYQNGGGYQGGYQNGGGYQNNSYNRGQYQSYGNSYGRGYYGSQGSGCGTGNLCCDLFIADTCCECMGGDLCGCF